MPRTIGICLFLMTLTLSGCGESDKPAADSVQVTGIISVNEQPSGNVLVTYHPQGSTAGHGGSGTTDSTGKYEILTPQGKKGLVAGTYKVTLSRRLNPDGSPPDPNTPPIESSARETLPAMYTDPNKTQLSITLAVGDKRSFDFAVKAGKK